MIYELDLLYTLHIGYLDLIDHWISLSEIKSDLSLVKKSYHSINFKEILNNYQAFCKSNSIDGIVIINIFYSMEEIS